MFGKDAAKKAEQDAAQQRTQQQQYIEKAAAPDPYTEMVKKRNMDFLEAIKKPDLDVTKLSDLAPYVSMNNFGEAAAKREQEKQGIGALRMGQNATDPALASLIATNRAEHRAERAGGALEQAFAQRYGEATGSALPFGQLALSKGLGLASLASNNSRYASSRADELGARSGFFNSSFYKAMQDAARTAAMAA